VEVSRELSGLDLRDHLPCGLEQVRHLAGIEATPSSRHGELLVEWHPEAKEPLDGLAEGEPERRSDTPVLAGIHRRLGQVMGRGFLLRRVEVLQQPGGQELATLARGIFEAVDSGTRGEPAEQVEAQVPGGAVFASRTPRWTLAVVARRQALPSLMLYDLRSVLGELEGGPRIVRREAAA